MLDRMCLSSLVLLHLRASQPLMPFRVLVLQRLNGDSYSHGICPFLLR